MGVYVKGIVQKKHSIPTICAPIVASPSGRKHSQNVLMK